jgi:hypothetical protein
MLGAVRALRDVGESGGDVVRESWIRLRHALDDVGLRVALIHQLARSSADDDGVSCVVVGDTGVVERRYKGRIGPGWISLRRRGKADHGGDARKHYRQSHRLIFVQIGTIISTTV